MTFEQQRPLRFHEPENLGHHGGLAAWAEQLTREIQSVQLVGEGHGVSTLTAFDVGEDTDEVLTGPVGGH